VLSIAGRVTIR